MKFSLFGLLVILKLTRVKAAQTDPERVVTKHMQDYVRSLPVPAHPLISLDRIDKANWFLQDSSRGIGTPSFESFQTYARDLEGVPEDYSIKMQRFRCEDGSSYYHPQVVLEQRWSRPAVLASSATSMESAFTDDDFLGLFLSSLLSRNPESLLTWRLVSRKWRRVAYVSRLRVLGNAKTPSEYADIAAALIFVTARFSIAKYVLRKSLTKDKMASPFTVALVDKLLRTHDALHEWAALEGLLQPHQGVLSLDFAKPPSSIKQELLELEWADRVLFWPQLFALVTSIVFSNILRSTLRLGLSDVKWTLALNMLVPGLTWLLFAFIVPRKWGGEQLFHRAKYLGFDQPFVRAIRSQPIGAIVLRQAVPALGEALFYAYVLFPLLSTK